LRTCFDIKTTKPSNLKLKHKNIYKNNKEKIKEQIRKRYANNKEKLREET
jgi:hypothetical protein